MSPYQKCIRYYDQIDGYEGNFEICEYLYR